MGADVARWKEMGRSWRCIEEEEGSALPRGSTRRAESTVTPAFRPVACYRQVAWPFQTAFVFVQWVTCQ